MSNTDQNESDFNIWEWLAELELLYCVILFLLVFIVIPVVLSNTLLSKPIADYSTSNGQHSVEHLQGVVDIIQNNEPPDQSTAAEE